MEDKNYIRQIMRRLECPKGKRLEIKKDLTMDILAAEENGESWEDIKKRMGSPATVAEEFNSNFSEEERKKYKKEKRIRHGISFAFIAIFVFIVGFYWIVPKSISIQESKIFNEKEVLEKAEYIIHLIEEEDYKTLQENANEEVKKILKKEVLDKAKMALSSDWGNFQSFGNYYMADVKQMGRQLGIIQMNASYENTSVTYTISFDKEMKLAGLYIK